MSKRSAMWEFFDADGYWDCTNGENDGAVAQARPSDITQAVVCKLCGSRIKRQSGNTSNMRSHMLNHHPKELRPKESGSDRPTAVASSTQLKLSSFASQQTFDSEPDIGNLSPISSVSKGLSTSCVSSVPKDHDGMLKLKPENYVA